ncbi:MAG: hypothetical protein PHC61_10240 [Chitinivibrionales bacterium]|nr:hypothetical protein [Chitinivibrionales bacterium]
MINIDTPDQLISSHAIKGDPTAFYLLIIPFAKSTYLALRNNGMDHKNAMSTLAPFIKKLYESRDTLVQAESGEAWYRKNEQKAGILQQPEAGQIDLENIVPPNAALFENDLQTFLMRLNHREQNRTIRTPGQRRMQSIWIKIGVAIAIIIIIPLALIAVLSATHYYCSFTIANNKSAFSLTLPFDFAKTKFAPQMSAHDSAALIKPPEIEPAVKDTKTVMVIAPPVKKPLVKPKIIRRDTLEVKTPSEPALSPAPQDSSSNPPGDLNSPQDEVGFIYF